MSWRQSHTIVECGTHIFLGNRNKSTKNNTVLIILCVEKVLEPILNALKACSCAPNSSLIINCPIQLKLKLEPN